jgi:hypothetical protein
MYKASSRNNIITENAPILSDGFGSITIKNIGDDAAVINDNIPLSAGSSFVWENHPNVIIDETIYVRFAGVEALQKVLVFKTYYKEDVNNNSNNQQDWKPNKR